MKIKTIFPAPQFLMFLFLFFAAAFASGGHVFANTFNLQTDAPGWCFDRGTQTDNVTNVYLACCGDGQTSSYQVNYTGQLNLVYPSSCNNCTFTYNCGACTTANTKYCTVATTTPANAQCTNSPALTQACTYTPPTDTCTYTYNCGACTPNNVKTCTVTATNPAGVQCYNEPILTQTCVYTPASSPCTGYGYSDWSGCKSDGTQTRSIVSSIPTGCLITTNGSAVPEALSRKCTVCAYNCSSDWSACASGVQTLTCSATPASCVPPDDLTQIPSTRRSCTDTANNCVYTCNNWDSCNAVGSQNCIGFTQTPSGVTCSNLPPTGVTQSCSPAAGNCSYSCEKWGDCAATGIQICTVVKSFQSGTSCSNPLTGPITRNCTYTDPSKVPCVYSYGTWATSCDAAGMVTRTYTAQPAGCSQVPAPVIKEPCSICVSYTYGDWSACDAAGKQTRSIKTQSPGGCTNTEAAVLSQACAAPVPCEFKCGDWNTCGAAGMKTRTCVKSPSGCTVNPADAPPVQQACVPEPAACVYTYGAWSDCGNNGIQKRDILSKSPDGCQGGAAAVIEQKCESGPAVDEPVKKPEEGKVKIAPQPCTYSYSAWADCIEGKQLRMVISQLPDGCDETLAAPVLERGCTAAVSPVVFSRPADAPAAAPQSVVEMPAATDEKKQNYNGRTSSEWQKYYFGADICEAEKVCGGLADPDNDGLNNNEEFRFGTDPKNADTDHDGVVDGQEISAGRDPLVPGLKDQNDKMVFQDPRTKETGVVKAEIYKVEGTLKAGDTIETVKTKEGEKVLKFTGHALPNTYVTVYVYSEPIVLTIKTDRDGNWSYVLDKPLDQGDHIVYVAVTDNTGKVAAKSAPLLFTQTAEAATVLPSKETPSERTTPPTKSRLSEGYLFMAFFILCGLALALATVGIVKSKGQKIE